MATGTRVRRGMAAALLSTGLAMTGCASANDDAEATVTVLAAASLTESFTAIAGAFEMVNPDIEVQISFGPSSGLVSQVIEGASADVLATANSATMATATEADVVEVSQVFATNALAIAIPASNPAGITEFGDVARPGTLVAVCEPQVPCGAAADEVIAASGLPIQPVTFEVDVKGVLNKVILDEVDAGMVYTTDIAAAGDAVRAIPIPSDFSVSVAYPIARVSNAPDAPHAQRFIDFVLSRDGQAILQRFGFGSPQ